MQNEFWWRGSTLYRRLGYDAVRQLYAALQWGTRYTNVLGDWPNPAVRVREEWDE